MINSIINTFFQQIDEMLIIFFSIIFLIILQKYYYNMLFYIANTNKLLSFVFRFFIRFWVILHEFAHMFFAFLFWNKIQEVKLFEKNGWYVKYAYKNYIAALPDGFNHITYWFMLIINQFWIFLTALWPMIVGIWLSYLLFWTSNFNLHNINNFVQNNLGYLVVYILLVPSFVISWKDFSHLIISKQYWIIATIIASVINFSIFILLLFIMSYFVNYFFIFVISFLISFVIIFILYLITYIFKYLKN